MLANQLPLETSRTPAIAREVAEATVVPLEPHHNGLRGPVPVLRHDQVRLAGARGFWGVLTPFDAEVEMLRVSTYLCQANCLSIPTTPEKIPRLKIN